MDAPRVRHLRTNATPAETLLWHQLRKKRVGGRRFRRQFAIGRYIVDFVCLPARLVVEVDGPTHEQTQVRDAMRTSWLEGQGFRVIRFSNEEVFRNLDGVVRTIELAVKAAAAPPPYPLPQGEGGRKRGVAPKS